MISVVGLGKIGLPLATQFAKKGFHVFGIDINKNTIEQVNKGITPFPGETNLELYLKEVVANKKLIATSDFKESISKSSYIVVIVPVYVQANGDPDFKSIDAATRNIGRSLKRGSLISFETTLPIGTTRKRLSKILEEESFLKAGEDFFVVFSPERVFSGRVFEDLKKYPKLVGGINKKSTELGIAFYSEVLDFYPREELSKPNGVWGLESSEEAEFAKLAETTYRDVNIALANEFALFAQNNELNLSNVIEACNSQPFSHIHNPGIAVGGHCIPIYPRMYLWNDNNADVVRTAREKNESLPGRMIEGLIKVHGDLKNQKIVILGAAYRGGVKETAFSGVFALSIVLKNKGAKVLVHDPLYNDSELQDLGLSPYHLGEKVDAAILQAMHDEYRNLNHLSLPGLKTLVDGRGFLSSLNWPGVKMYVIGKGFKDSKEVP
jgi:nucleotide sugar dehydrogenase